MLLQGNTIVVFYESFNSNSSYTRLGKIHNVQNLKAAVGSGSVEIRFSAEWMCA